MKSFLIQQWFLVALVIIFAGGFWLHRELNTLAQQEMLRDCLVAVCMLLMALPLEANAIWSTLRRPWAILLAVAVTFGLLPLVAWLLAPLLTRDYGSGLLVAAVTPCTMASATVWTRKAGGNDTAATVVTVVSNLLCFIITPAWLFLLTGKVVHTNNGWHEFWAMMFKLCLIVVLPVLVAQTLRLYGPIAEFSRQRKKQLSFLSQCAILFMVMIGAVKTGAKLQGAPFEITHLGELLTMIVVVLSLHTSMFWAGLHLARVFGLVRADQIAVGFAGSQKTLMVGMKVSLDQGFSVLPMVTYHVGQLFIDTLLADRIKRHDANAK